MAENSTKPGESTMEGTNQSNSNNNAFSKAVAQEKEDVNSKLVDKDGDEESETVTLDGGYGWAIVMASFLTNVIVDGVCFSLGIFLVEFLDYYGGTKAKMAWVGSVLNGMYLSIGPIVSGLSNKFGCRAVAITGSIIATASYILSTFSPSVNVLILTYGAMGGFGFGLMYLPAIVMVGFYFDKKRAFATGIAVCGSGIGAFVFAPLCRFLIDTFAWQGATWIIAGICLQGVVIGSLFRPLVPSSQKSTEKGVMQRVCDNKQRNLSECEATPTVRLLQNETRSDCIHSMQNLTPTNLGEAKRRSFARSCGDLASKTADTASKARDLRVAALSKPLARKDIFYGGSIEHLPEYQKAGGNIDKYVENVTVVSQNGVHQLDDADKGHAWGKSQFATVAQTLHRVMGISLLTNPVFLIYGISCFLCMTGFFVPFIFLPDHADQMGLTKQQGALLISIIGIANTIARVLCGFVSDLVWVDCLLLNNLALIMAGVATILCPYCINFGLLATYTAVFGSGIAVFVSLRSIIVVDLLGLDNLTGAFGLVTMFQGLSAFIGAPIAGALFDATGNYNYSFYLAGITLALSGIINLPLRRLAKHLNNKNKANNDVENSVIYKKV